MKQDWTREGEFESTAKRRVYFSVTRPPGAERFFRIRFGDSHSHSTGASPDRIAEVSSDFPIVDNQDSVKVALESCGASWETIYDGKAGESTQDAIWDLNQVNGSLLIVQNACPPDQQYDFAYRLTLDPPIEEYKGVSPVPDSTGRIVLFNRSHAKKLKKLRIERSKYSSLYTGWLAFGRSGSESTARRSVTEPTFLGAFSGKQDLSQGKMGEYYQRDSIGWNRDGHQVQLENLLDRGPTISMDSKQPGWVAFRIPTRDSEKNYKLFDDADNLLDAETRTMDPGDGGGLISIKSISSKWIKPTANLRLKVGVGDFAFDRDATVRRSGDYFTKLQEGEFLVTRHYSKRGELTQVDVLAGFSLDSHKEYRIIPIGAGNVRLSGGGELRGPNSVGTIIGAFDREAEVEKVILESRPYKVYNFDGIPLIKPKAVSKD